MQSKLSNIRNTPDNNSKQWINPLATTMAIRNMRPNRPVTFRLRMQMQHISVITKQSHPNRTISIFIGLDEKGMIAVTLHSIAIPSAITPIKYNSLPMASSTACTRIHTLPLSFSNQSPAHLPPSPLYCLHRHRRLIKNPSSSPFRPPQIMRRHSAASQTKCLSILLKCRGPATPYRHTPSQFHTKQHNVCIYHWTSNLFDRQASKNLSSQYTLEVHS